MGGKARRVQAQAEKQGKAERNSRL